MSIWSVSAVDGRYAQEVSELSPLVSEGALIRYRIQVESAWLFHLSQPTYFQNQIGFRPEVLNLLASWASGSIDPILIEQAKEQEKKTNHDVKAVEYVLRDLLQKRVRPLRSWRGFTLHVPLKTSII